MGMVQHYHAHIYFRPWQRELAQSLYWETKAIAGVTRGSFHEGMVGPHPLPMFTLMFRGFIRSEVKEFLETHRHGLVVLIHEDTGDDIRDHTSGAEWLGEPLAIKFEHFERIKYEKSALVFPER